MPIHSIEDAERWRVKHLDGMRTKQHRLDGNTGRKVTQRAAGGQPVERGSAVSPVVASPVVATMADLVAERTRLAKEQADKMAMQNAVQRGELAPVALIEEVLTKAASKVAGILDAIPGMIRRRVPLLTADDIDRIAAEIAKARNRVAGMSLADLYAADEAPVDSPPTTIDEP
ncbi:MAG: terminase small subunit [Rhodocyclaceae bacterium]